MINSRKIEDLNPKVADLCHAFIAKCADAGIDILITSTYRDSASQNALYEQGRTTKGAKVTNAKGGGSYHNYKVAFDFVPMVAGKARWNDAGIFEQCGHIAESLGLEWAGRWTTFKELAHCQYTEGRTLAQLKQQYNIG